MHASLTTFPGTSGGKEMGVCVCGRRPPAPPPFFFLRGAWVADVVGRLAPSPILLRLLLMLALLFTTSSLTSSPHPNSLFFATCAANPCPLARHRRRRRRPRSQISHRIASHSPIRRTPPGRKDTWLLLFFWSVSLARHAAPYLFFCNHSMRRHWPHCCLSCGRKKGDADDEISPQDE